VKHRRRLVPKEPVLLVVLIETTEYAWFVAGITMTGAVHPLMRSEPENLTPYRGAAFDEQVSFLRHRLSGVLQRGCDRLWGRQMKPCQIVFVTDAPFQDASPELTQAVAEHFVQWMANPPVAFFVSHGGFAPQLSQFVKLAGDISVEHQQVLHRGLSDLSSAVGHPDLWELNPVKPRNNDS
jgi:hypothetical protein